MTLLVTLAGMFTYMATVRGLLSPAHQDNPRFHLELIGICFLGFSVLLLTSTLIGVYANFYNAKDLFLILPAPIKPSELFFSRIMQVALSSGWMFFFLALPATLAYIKLFHLSYLFLPIVILISALYVILHVALSYIIVTIVIRFIPHRKFLDLIIILAILCVLIFATMGYDVVRYLTFNEKLTIPGEQLHLKQTLKHPGPSWLPSLLVQNIFEGLIKNDFKPAVNSLYLLLLMLFSAVGGAFMVFRSYFSTCFTITNESGRHQHSISFTKRYKLPIVIPLSPQLRSLITKEYRLFFRDTAQALQLLVVLMLAFLYLFNFHELRKVDAGGDEEAVLRWRATLAVGNIFLSTFVSCAFAARFAYPAVSLEGKAFAYLRATPLSIARLLQAKFCAWFFPVAIISMVLVSAGAFALQLSIPVILLSNLYSFAMSAGLVGLGIFVGSIFVKFDWENVTQITSSLGVLVYIFASFLYAGICIGPGAIALLLLEYTPDSLLNYHEYLSLMIVGGILIVLFANIITTLLSLHFAKRVLERREC